MLEIILKVRNEKNKIEDCKYKVDYISLRKMKKVAAMYDKIAEQKDTLLTEIILEDEYAEFIVDLYDNQFTLDELLDGFPGNKFINKLFTDLVILINGINEKVKN